MSAECGKIFDPKKEEETPPANKVCPTSTQGMVKFI
jgi:hypothetical protein